MSKPDTEIDELDLYRALQTLKDKDGNYVLSTISFSSQYGLQSLIEFIEDRESKLKAHYARQEAEIRASILDELSNDLDDIKGSAEKRYYPYQDDEARFSHIVSAVDELEQKLTPQAEQERGDV